MSARGLGGGVRIALWAWGGCLLILGERVVCAAASAGVTSRFLACLECGECGLHSGVVLPLVR